MASESQYRRLEQRVESLQRLVGLLATKLVADAVTGVRTQLAGDPLGREVADYLTEQLETLPQRLATADDPMRELDFLLANWEAAALARGIRLQLGFWRPGPAGR